MKKWLSICLCMVLFLGIIVSSAYAEPSTFGDLRYTLPEGWTQRADGGSMSLNYAGSSGEVCTVAFLKQDMSYFAGAGLDTPAFAEIYLKGYLKALYQEMGATLPDIATSLRIDNQIGVRYSLREGEMFLDASAVLYGEMAYAVLSLGEGENAYAGFETLFDSLNFGGDGAGTPAQTELDPLADLSDADVTVLRDRAVEALGAKELALQDGEFVVGEDIPAGRYVFYAADPDLLTVVKILNRDEIFGSAGGERVKCELMDGDTIRVTGSGILMPWLNVLVPEDAQSVGDIHFILPPGWIGSGDERGFSGFTQANTQARSCGDFVVGTLTLDDAAIEKPEETLQMLCSQIAESGYTIEASNLMEIEGRPSLRFSVVSSEELLYNPCMEAFIVLDGNVAYNFMVRGQDLYQDNYAQGMDVLVENVTFDAIEPLPELSAQIPLENMDENTLRKIYTLCEFSLIRRGVTPEVILPQGICTVGIDFPAGTYEATASTVCRYGDIQFFGGNDTPEIIVLEDGQSVECLGEARLKLQ